MVLSFMSKTFSLCLIGPFFFTFREFPICLLANYKYLDFFSLSNSFLWPVFNEAHFFVAYSGLLGTYSHFCRSSAQLHQGYFWPPRCFSSGKRWTLLLDWEWVFAPKWRNSSIWESCSQAVVGWSVRWIDESRSCPQLNWSCTDLSKAKLLVYWLVNIWPSPVVMRYRSWLKEEISASSGWNELPSWSGLSLRDKVRNPINKGELWAQPILHL